MTSSSSQPLDAAAETRVRASFERQGLMHHLGAELTDVSTSASRR